MANMRNAYKMLVRREREIRPLKDQDLYGRIILKWTSKM
jgi:hypothetical protein